LWSWYYKKLIEKIDHYILRNYSSMFCWIMLHMIMTDLLRLLDYILDDTDITCTTLHLSLGIVTVYMVPWSWYTLYSLSDTDILDTDSWSCYTESHTILYLHWLIKLIKPEYLGETGSRGSGRCAWKGGSSEGLATRDLVFLWFMHAPVITYYMIPE